MSMSFSENASKVLGKIIIKIQWPGKCEPAPNFLHHPINLRLHPHQFEPLHSSEPRAIKLVSLAAQRTCQPCCLACLLITWIRWKFTESYSHLPIYTDALPSPPFKLSRMARICPLTPYFFMPSFTVWMSLLDPKEHFAESESIKSAVWKSVSL